MRRPGPLCIRLLTAAVVMLAGSACGQPAAPTPGLLTADPRTDLLSMDQLPSPDFTVNEAAHPLTAAQVAAGSTSVADALSRDGLQGAAAVRYFRTVTAAIANGPFDIVDTVERFASVEGATATYTRDVLVLDAASDATVESTGPLGDAAHAVSVRRTAPNAVPLIQYTLEWRVGNVINVMIVRGRYGGTRLADATALAQKQTAVELRAG